MRGPYAKVAARNAGLLAANHDWNTYVIPDASNRYWEFYDRSKSWNDLRKLAYERNGAVTIERRPPTELSCNR